jgi:hypothetical protein
MGARHRLDEGLLEQILGIGLVVAQQVGRTEESIRVAIDELFDPGRVSLPQRLDESSVFHGFHDTAAFPGAQGENAMERPDLQRSCSGDLWSPGI